MNAWDCRKGAGFHEGPWLVGCLPIKEYKGAVRFLANMLGYVYAAEFNAG